MPRNKRKRMRRHESQGVDQGGDGGRGKRKRKERPVGNDQQEPGQERGAGYPQLVKENELFEKFYKGLGIVPMEEWDDFMATMRENLPATFRVTGTRTLAEAVRMCLETRFFSELSGLEVEGEQVPPPVALPWYPNRLAWHVKLSKRFIRKSPLLAKFHSFLVSENEQGNISRQEAVSMIPPLLLDVQPHHKVLDMCAAPGSKTAQLIEFLHAEHQDSTAAMPTGVVVANDADNRRCYMLVHQAKRLNSPCLMVTNHDASVYPILYYHNEEDVRCPLYYDRVLCDVPCSGDGTLRKNPTIWKQWTPSRPLSLHKLQLRILNRGLELLVPGGRLVYSTCSLNPVEDEAVVATALQLCKGAVELVDWSDKLPGLRRVPGVATWKVMLKGGIWVNSHADVPRASQATVPQSSFPPEPTDVQELHLERCGRVLPHHQDTGGFFIAVLEKKEWLPWQRKQKMKLAGSVGEREGKGSEEGGSIPLPVQSESVDGSTANQDITDSTALRTVVKTCDNASSPPDTASAGTPQDSAQDTTATSEITSELCNTTAESQDTSILPSDSMHDTAKTIGSATSLGSDTFSASEMQAGITTATGASGQLPQGLTEGESMEVEKELESAVEGGKGPEQEERPKESILGKPGFQQRKRCFKEDPYVFLSDSDVYGSIKSHFGLPDSFPANQLMTRSLTGKKRNLYLASRLVKELTQRNEHSVKIINIGVKILSRCDHPKATCSFRICQEGIEAIGPFISSHVVPITTGDLENLLLEPNPLTSSLSTQAQQTLQHLGIGPALFKYTPDSQGSCGKDTSSTTFLCPLSLSGWVAAKSVRLYVDRKYRYHFLAMMGHDPPENQSLVPICGAQDEEGGKEATKGGEEENMVERGSEDGGVEGSEGEDASEAGGGGAPQVPAQSSPTS